MKSKWFYILIGIILLVAVFLGGTVVGQSEEVSNNMVDAYYVENTGNIFVGIAKTIDKAAYFIVDIIISGVESIFNNILGWFVKKMKIT